MIKEELGPDAVILSTKDVRGRNLMTHVQVMAMASKVVKKKGEILKDFQLQNRHEFINDSREAQKPQELTKIPYIQIPEGENKGVADGVQRAVQQAYIASGLLEGPPKNFVEPRGQTLESLQNEITHLKSVISDFQKVPQGFLSLHPDTKSGVPYEMSYIFDKLTRAGVNAETATDITKRAQEAMGSRHIESHHLVNAWIVRHLLDSIVCTTDRFEGRYHAFVGRTGHGKTSTLVKLASQMGVSQQKSIGIVAADHTKIGVVEQLKTYASILNTAFASVRDSRDWESVNQEFSQLDCILVDCPGTSLRNEEEISNLMKILPPESHRKVHYVQSILSREIEMDGAIKPFSQLGIDDIIFTRLDESFQHGIILNIQKKYGLPLHSFGIGPHIPEDMEAATGERVVDLIFKLTKIKEKEVSDDPK